VINVVSYLHQVILQSIVFVCRLVRLLICSFVIISVAWKRRRDKLDMLAPQAVPRSSPLACQVHAKDVVYINISAEDHTACDEYTEGRCGRLSDVCTRDAPNSGFCELFGRVRIRIAE